MLDQPALVDPSFTVDPIGTSVAQVIVADGIGRSPPGSGVFIIVRGGSVVDAEVRLAAGGGLLPDGGHSREADENRRAHGWTSLGFGNDGEAGSPSRDEPAAVSPIQAWDDGASGLIRAAHVDESAASPPDAMLIYSIDSRPAVDAGLAATVIPLDGIGSADLGDGSLTVRWASPAAPQASTGGLANPTALQPSLKAELPGTYVARFTVNDGAFSLSDTVMAAATGQALVEATSEAPAAAQNEPSADAAASVGPDPTMASSDAATIPDERRAAPLLAMSRTLAAPASSARIPAFPGCEGSGCAATGGRGGRVIEVTNLNDSEAGSLRACVEAAGPRTCVFRVGGTIELQSGLEVRTPHLTVAGQTAPGGGILLSGKSLPRDGDAVVQVSTRNVIWRYTRIRKGQTPGCTSEAVPGCDETGSGFDIIGGDDKTNIVFDHNSVSWNEDEGIGLWANDDHAARDVTFSWNLHGEPLAIHPTSWMCGANTDARKDRMTNIDWHHNMISTTGHRMPNISCKTTRFVSNIFYNWGWSTMHPMGGANVDIISNIWKRGPQSPDDFHEVMVGGNVEGPSGTPSIYMSGNIGFYQTDPADDQWLLTAEATYQGPETASPIRSEWRRATPLAAPKFPIAATPVDQLESVILPIVGASRRLDCDGSWVNARDSVDARLIDYYITGRGYFRHNGPVSEAEVGGFPTIAGRPPCADADRDGMPDVWELSFGLDPSDPADRNGDLDGDGYTNLEEFLSATNPSSGS